MKSSLSSCLFVSYLSVRGAPAVFTIGRVQPARRWVGVIPPGGRTGRTLCQNQIEKP